MQITVKNPKTSRSINVDVNIPETLDEQVAAFGAGIVADCCVDELVLRAQAKIRTLMSIRKDGSVVDDATIITTMSSWKPGIRTARGTGGLKKSQKDLLAELLALSPEDRDAKIRALLAQ